MRWGAAPKREPPGEDAAGDDAARATRGDKAAGASAGTRPAPGNAFLTHAQSKRRQSGLYRSRVTWASARQAPDRCWQTGTVDVALRELSVPGLAKGFPAIQILQSLQERPVGDKFRSRASLPTAALAHGLYMRTAGRGRSMLACITLVARQASALVAAPPLRVLCYGDSLTAGTSPPLDTLHPYAPQLEAAIGPSVLVRH